MEKMLRGPIDSPLLHAVCPSLFLCACVSHIQSFYFRVFQSLFVVAVFASFSPSGFISALSLSLSSSLVPLPHPHLFPQFQLQYLREFLSWPTSHCKLKWRPRAIGKEDMGAPRFSGSTDKPGRRPKLWNFSTALPAGGNIQPPQAAM